MSSKKHAQDGRGVKRPTESTAECFLSYAGAHPRPLRFKIHYLQGDATKPAAAGPAVIAHVCNDAGKWGKGFVLAVSKRWKQPEEYFRKQHGKDPKPRLGDVQFVEVEPKVTVANIIGQHGIKRGASAGVPIRYEAIEEGLAKVADYALSRQAGVHMPRIGCGLAGGTWEEIEPIIERTLLEKGVEVFVYDFGG